MTLADILLPYQKKFVEVNSKIKLWVSSRQIGKSFTLAFISVYEALKKDNSLVLCISTGSRASEELLKKCQQMAESACLLSDGKLHFTSTSDTIKFSNKSRILSLPSGNTSALRGWSSVCTIIDEAAFIERPEEVYEAIVPTLTRNPEAKLILASTPAGCKGLFYDLYASSNQDIYKQVTTIEDAVRDGLNVDINDLKSMMSEDSYLQEYMCRFSKDMDVMLDTNKLDFYSTPVNSSTVYFSADIGRTQDSSAVIIAKYQENKVFIEDILLLKKTDYQTQLNIFKDLNKKYNFQAGYIDSTGIGSAVAEFTEKQISTKIKGWTFTSSNKTPMYERIRDYVFQHKIIFNEKFKDIIIDDFKNVRRFVSQSGQVRFEAGRNMNGHSDIVSALSLVLQAITDNPVNISSPITFQRASVFSV